MRTAMRLLAEPFGPTMALVSTAGMTELPSLAGPCLQVDVDECAPAQGLPCGVLRHSEVAVCLRLPDVLLVAAVLADDLHIVSNKVDRVETDTKLPNEIDISTLLHLLQEGCAQLGLSVCAGLLCCSTNRGSCRPPEVPDLAMVPKLLISSFLVMPTPVSRMVSSRFSGSRRNRTSRSVCLPRYFLSVRDRKRVLSSASAALEMSSRRKMSLLEYNELIRMSISLLTSAWKVNFSAPFRGAGVAAALLGTHACREYSLGNHAAVACLQPATPGLISLCRSQGWRESCVPDCQSAGSTAWLAPLKAAPALGQGAAVASCCKPA